MKGKCKSGSHRRDKRSDEEIEKEVLVISVDYMGQKSEALRLCLQSREWMKIKVDHPVLPWLFHDAALLTDVCRLEEDRRTPYERRRGKRFNHNQQGKTRSTPGGTRMCLQECERNRENSMSGASRE